MSFAPDKEEIDDACARGDVAALRSMLETVEAERLVLMANQLKLNPWVVLSALRKHESACNDEKGVVGLYMDTERNTRRVFISHEHILRWLGLSLPAGT